MKFWKILRYLIEQTLPEWQDKFLSYKDLKKQLRLIYPKEAEADPSYGPSKRARVAEGSGGGDCPAAADGMEKEVSDFVMLLEDEIDKFNEFFVDKEERYIIRLKVLKDCVANVEDLNEELMTIVREIVDFHGEMVLLLNYSALNYTGLVKIIKKYDKRSGALIRLPFIQKVLQQPFFKTDILNKLVKECGAMLDQFFSSKRLATCQAAETKEELDPEIEAKNKPQKVTDELDPEIEAKHKPQKVTDELAEIKNIENMYLKQILAALEVLNKIRSGSSTVNEFSLPPLHRNNREEA